MADITITTVSSKKELMRFIKFPWKIYQSDSNWVPPLIMDRKNLLDKKRNPFYKHAEMDLFLAFKEGELVGRIAAITNDNHNRFHEDKMGFFGFYESINDNEVTKKLFDSVVSWLKDHGMTGMYGPMNPSTNDETGLLIKGFDKPPYIMMCHNPPYYQTLIEDYGLEKAKDLYAWYVDAVNDEVPERTLRIVEKLAARYGIKIRNIRLKELKKEVELVREVYNNAWSRNWGFVPLTDEEIDHAAVDLKQIADEEFILFGEKDGRVIGFSLTLPNINEILIKNPSGRLLPTGIFKLLTGIKKVKTMRTVMLGVIKEYQHAGLGALFYIETLHRAKRRGIVGGETSWVLEDNTPMNNAIESLGSKIYKTYRIYQKIF
jgi:GNAT superfamily N-acetyltransferase